MMHKHLRSLALSFIAAALALPAMAQSAGTQITQLLNVYSPSLVKQANGTVAMYIGGWKDAPPNDTIYRLTCTGPASCTDPVPVILPMANGLWHLNDPTLVTLNDANSTPYLLMYMTGVENKNNDWNQGFDPKDNKIYYTTSWANDGVNWAAPRLLIDGLWLPSAAVKEGEVYLYGNSTENGVLYRYALGASGVDTSRGREPVSVVYPDGTAANLFYMNVDVTYRPALGLYQILAEHVYDWATPRSRIDYLTSTDGLTWKLEIPDVLGTASGSGGEMIDRVLTPAAWPDTHCWVYFGVEKKQPNGDRRSNVFYKPWC